MNKVWDVENDKFVVVEDKCLNIQRKMTDESSADNYISSYKMTLADKLKTEDIMNKMAYLWNNSSKEDTYNMEQVVVKENECTIKMSVFYDKNKDEHFMKFRLISKDIDGRKNIDYIKLDRIKSRLLYAGIKNTLNLN